MASASEAITVLLVDDDPDVAAVTRLNLERQDESFELLVEHSAADALDVLDVDVDCVVSDYEMPDKDGLEFLRDVRAYDETLPFILFTGRGSEEIASEAISAGVTDYLQKGVGTDQYAVLANRIENAVAHRRSAAAAAETETRYRSLVESSPHAILVHDGSEIRYANDRLTELAGTDDAADVLGRDPVSFVHPEDREMIGDRIERLFAGTSTGDWFEFRLVTLDDEIRRVETRATVVQYQGSRASQVVLRDVTDHYRRERQLEALHDATRRLLTAEDRDEVADVALDALENVFDAPVSAVWAYDADRNALAPLAVTESAARVETVDGFEPEVSALPDWTVEMAVFEAGEPRVVDDYADRDDTVTDAFETVFLSPLGDYGLFAIASREHRSFDDSERDLVGILARSVVATFDRLDG